MKVDKSKWERKTLKDIGTIVSGATPRTDDPLNWGDKYNWVTPAELKGEKYIGRTQKQITDHALSKTKLTLMPPGTVLLSSRAPIGKVAITTEPMYCNQGFKNIVCGNKFFNGFLYYYLIANQKELNRRGNGVTFKEISKKNVEAFPVIVPSLYEQQAIATELDTVQEMIDGYKAQIADLDTLAQSIFLDMFGDPVHNENSFPICTVGDIYEFRYGQGNNIPESKGNYPCYGSNGIVGYHINFNSEDAPIIGHIGAYAGIVNWGKGKHFVTYNGVRCILKRNDINPIYGFFLLRNQNYRNQTRGGAQPFVSYDILEAPKTFIPPLPLQQQFAERVESIERQKELICQQLTDAEQLMAERMQYYFS